MVIFFLRSISLKLVLFLPLCIFACIHTKILADILNLTSSSIVIIVCLTHAKITVRGPGILFKILTVNLTIQKLTDLLVFSKPYFKD